jgi:hypothetical protein
LVNWKGERILEPFMQRDIERHSAYAFSLLLSTGILITLVAKPANSAICVHRSEILHHSFFCGRGLIAFASVQASMRAISIMMQTIHCGKYALRGNSASTMMTLSSSGRETNTMIRPLPSAFCMPRHVRPFRSTEIVCMGRRSAKIAGRKGKADAAKAKLYGKLGKLIAQAVRSGGADPIANARLRDVLAQAKLAQLPADIIDRNLKKAADKNAADFSEMLYEAYGPGGTGFIIEVRVAMRQNLVLGLVCAPRAI